MAPDELFERLFAAQTDEDRQVLGGLNIPASLFTTFAVCVHRKGYVYVAVRRDGDLEFESAVPASAARIGEICDVVKWRVGQPSLWEQAYNEADLIGCCSFRATSGDGWVYLWRTPQAWLQSGCDGLCLLTRDSVDRRITLRGFKGLVCEDLTHAALVADDLAGGAGPLPKLWAPK